MRPPSLSTPFSPILLPRPQAPLQERKKKAGSAGLNGKGTNRETPSSRFFSSTIPQLQGHRAQRSHNSMGTLLKKGATPGDEAAHFAARFHVFATKFLPLSNRSRIKFELKQTFARLPFDIPIVLKNIGSCQNRLNTSSMQLLFYFCPTFARHCSNESRASVETV